MSIALIDAQLVIVEAAIAGVQKAATRPPQAPEPPDLPYVLNDYDPNDFMTPFDVSFGQIGYAWKYRIKFLISPPGLAAIDEWNTTIEPYFSKFTEALFSHLTLNGTCSNLDYLGGFKAGLGIPYLDRTYFGFESTWVFRELTLPTAAIAP